MFFHVGNDCLLDTADIIGIFDLDTSTVSKRTREYLKKATENNQVKTVSYELPKSFVVCTPPRKKGQTVYISQLSTATLQKRNDLLEKQVLSVKDGKIRF